MQRLSGAGGPCAQAARGGVAPDRARGGRSPARARYPHLRLSGRPGAHDRRRHRRAPGTGRTRGRRSRAVPIRSLHLRGRSVRDCRIGARPWRWTSRAGGCGEAPSRDADPSAKPWRSARDRAGSRLSTAPSAIPIERWRRSGRAAKLCGMIRPFLGVEQSATGRVWRDRIDERGSALALAIMQRHQLPDLLARILAGRGVDVDQAAAFLDPTVRHLMPDPAVLADMPAAAARIADAVARRETVAIFGDYDVDGATSAAVLARFLRICGLDSDRPHSGPAVRRLRPQCRGCARARGARRDAAGHGRLRRHQSRAARRSETAGSRGHRDRLHHPGRRGSCRRRSR